MTKTMPNPDEIDQATLDNRKAIDKRNRELKREEDRISPEPVMAEHEAPRAAETKKTAAKENSEVQRDQGSQIPQSSTRPQPPTGAKEEGSVIVAKALAEQLGTSPELKSEMRIDERKMGVLSDTTLAALSHFSYRFVYDGVRYWGHITEWWLTGSQGIGGLGRRHILQAIGASTGVQSVEKTKAPNVVARNLWKRDWKQKAEEEGKTPED